MHDKSTIEIELNHANSGLAAIVAAILKMPMEQLLSSCLEGSTNLKSK